MPVDLDVLKSQPLSLIRPATDALAAGGSIGAWRNAMAVAIRRSQTAAYIAATAERLGVPPSTVKGLSRAERRELEARIEKQLAYLDGFAADLKAGKLTMAQAAARADLYAGATRGGFYAARFPGLNQVPGDGGTPCLGNCKCSLEQRDDGVYWVLHPAEHCDGCMAMAAGSPYKLEGV